jgi:signal transduction histidine kinase
VRIVKLPEALRKRIAGLRRLRRIRRLPVDLWSLFMRLSKGVRSTLIFFAVIAFIGASGEIISTVVVTNDLSKFSWPRKDIASISQSRLDAIRRDLDSGVQMLALDSVLQHDLEDKRPQSDIFASFLKDYAKWIPSAPDSIRGAMGQENKALAERGAAVYDANGLLTAWGSVTPGEFSFDTVLSQRFITEGHVHSLRLEQTFFHTYLKDVHKLFGRSRALVGYAVTQRLLASQEPAGGGSLRTFTFLDDVKEKARRDIQLNFAARATPLNTQQAGTHLDSLYADRMDVASFVASLWTSDEPISDPPLVVRTFHTITAVAVSLLLLMMVFGLLNSAATMTTLKRPLVSRFIYSVYVLVSLCVVRVLLVQLNAVGIFFSPLAQDASDFASEWGFGIVRNPLELCITSIFAATAAIMLWIIWMPRKRLVHDDSAKVGIREIVRRESLPLIGYAIAAIIVSCFLSDVLGALIESLVVNGTLQYRVIRQVLPSPAALMMYLSFLAIGVAYLFLIALLLTFALRAFVFVLPRRISLVRRLVIASGLFITLILGVSIFFGAYNIGGLTSAYRFSLALLVACIGISVIVADAFVQHPFEHSPSFLYRLPRSSRSILFILAGSALVLSPLVSQKELLKDKEIAQQIVSQNSVSDIPYLKTIAEQTLASTNEYIRSWSASRGSRESLRQLAFITWLTSLQAHANWDAAIDVQDASGEVLSHFATPGAATQLNRLKSSRDSVLRKLIGPIITTATKAMDRNASQQSAQEKIEIISEPCFTATCGPLVTAATRTVIRIDTGTSKTRGPIIVTLSLWSELPALQSANALLDIGKRDANENVRSSDIVARGDFIVAQYVGRMRRTTNVPALDVPATLPSYLEYRLEREFNFWSPSTINGAKFLTLYHRMPSSAGIDAAPVIAVSIPEPGFIRAVELGLRLNTIGLLFGIGLALFILIVRQIITRQFRFVLKFRDRIFLIVLAIALLPLVIVTNVTRNLLREPAANEERDRLSRDATVITERIGHEIESGGARTNGAAFQRDAVELSKTIGRDFSVFDSRGRLLATSRPELYESSLIASHLSSGAMSAVMFGHKSFFTEPISIGDEVFQIGYQPVPSHDGNSVEGVVSVTTVGDQTHFEAEIARTTSLIYGTFGALGLVLIGIGALFAARVASPILTLIQATERVAKGKLHTSIRVSREDEIGELMHAFNAMTSELEKSRQLVAQTEREVAWKEMARQVAHEIKNPLTPMKLSVQHVEHAHEAKDPNFNSIFRRVMKTLGEQIDVLTRIATEFARFGEMPRRKYAFVPVRKVAERAVALFDADRNRIRFVIDLSKDLPPVHVDEEEFRRALVNLIRNAIQAIEGWGVVVIRAMQQGEMVHIELLDTGGGMNDETLAKAFDPNFSTKTSGMGLGLAIVKKTINDMGGIISVESTLGHGTKFTIELPVRGIPDIEEG